MVILNVSLVAQEAVLKKRRRERLNRMRRWRSVGVFACEGFVASLDTFWVVPDAIRDGANARFRKYPERLERGDAHARSQVGHKHQRGVQ